ncbi:hypothetical protein CSKR_112856, partial [Clonorchis sinensis]
VECCLEKHWPHHHHHHHHRQHDISVQHRCFAAVQPWVRLAAITCNVSNQAQRVAPTAPKRFVISIIHFCQVKGWPSLCFRHSELGIQNSTLFGKRSLGMRNTSPNQRTFWVPVAQPKTRFLIASCPNLANATRALQIRTFTSSVTLQSELIQLPRKVKRSTSSSSSSWIEHDLTLLGAKCIPKEGMNLVSSSNVVEEHNDQSGLRRIESCGKFLRVETVFH